MAESLENRRNIPSLSFLWPVPLAALVGLETWFFVVAATAVFLSFNLISKAFLSLLLDINQKHCFLGGFLFVFLMAALISADS